VAFIILKNKLCIRHAQIFKKIKGDFSGYEMGRGYTHFFLEINGSNPRLTYVLFLLFNTTCHSMALRAERKAQSVKAPQ
jgi:hypothetical protein